MTTILVLTIDDLQKAHPDTVEVGLGTPVPFRYPLRECIAPGASDLLTQHTDPAHSSRAWSPGTSPWAMVLCAASDAVSTAKSCAQQYTFLR